MKVFSILKPSPFSNPRPQEDFFAVSKKYPIFIVADGVALNFENENDYPKKSGAGEAAKIFCEIVIKEAEKRYENFKEQDLAEIFKIGNKAVLEYNISQGRTKDTINYFDVDLFSATTSFLLVKDKKIYWWSLCDSGVALFDNKGKKIFASPNGWEICEKNLPKNWNDLPEKEKIKIRHKDYRNKVDKKNKPIGYGVANGEEKAIFYLNTGKLDVNAGDLVFLYTDGFENYFSLKEFINLFKLWPQDMETKLEKIIAEKSRENLKKYGPEKTLIAISL